MTPELRHDIYELGKKAIAALEERIMLNPKCKEQAQRKINYIRSKKCHG